MWFPRNGISCLFSELSYLTSISLKCKLCPMQSYDPWQVLTFATSAKVPLTSSCLSTHRCACACAIGTQPQNILSGWFGEEKVFWRVHTAEKPRQRIQRVLGKTCTNVPCLPGLGNPSWDQNAHRNERTTFHTSNSKHIGIRHIAEIQWHFVTSQVLSIWERPSGIYGIPVVHKNIWLPQCWRRDSYIFNVAVFTCVPC